jgi:hypothetical protein
MTFESKPQKKYVGKCHCGDVNFSFTSAEITSGMRCNCSICIRKGCVMTDFYIPAKDLSADFSSNKLSNYLWNEKVLNHYFCKKCGVSPFAGAGEYGYRANLGCVDELDPLSLKIRVVDGKSMPLAEDARG